MTRETRGTRGTRETRERRPVGELTLITGGVRSGKSAFAERRAARLAEEGGGRSGAVTYVATARAWDAEMAARIERHRARRPAAWRTVEAPLALAHAVADALDAGAAVVLVDSVDFWVSNRLLEANPVSGTQLHPWATAALERELVAEAETVIARHRQGKAHLLLVTIEAGMGVVPPHPLGRAFRDLLGRVNTTFAAAADRVYLLVAGLPVDVKRLSRELQQGGEDGPRG
jgi:adenosylcobinamide kinase/adenosylcobinamide-phosphate guanylyltransferase